MFNFKKKKVIVEEVINKCYICKKKDSIGRISGFYYCPNNSCGTKLYKKLQNLDFIKEKAGKIRGKYEKKKKKQLNDE